MLTACDAVGTPPPQGANRPFVLVREDSRERPGMPTPDPASRGSLLGTDGDSQTECYSGALT